jgi:PAS domain S-box-containing protein
MLEVRDRSLDEPGLGPGDFAWRLVDALPVPVFFKGRDGAYLGVNKAWEAFFGVDRARMVGAHASELYAHAPAIGERHRAMDESLWLNPGEQSYEITVVTGDGRTRHTVYYKATFNGPDGRVAGIIGTIIDVTDRKRAEQSEAIEHAVARYLGSGQPLEEAIRGILQVMCERLDWACAARWSLGRDNHLHCIETWSVDDPAVQAFQQESARATFSAASQGLIRQVLSTGKSIWIEDVARREDFLRAPAARAAGLHGAFALPVMMGDEVLGAVEFFSSEPRPRDDWLLQVSMAVGNQIGQLLARRQAEAALRASEARFRSLTDLSSDWYWEQDEEMRFTLISVGSRDAVGLAPETFVGQRRWDVEMVGVTEEALAEHKALLAAHRPFHDFEYGRRREDGRVCYVSVSGIPMFDDGGRFTGYRGVGKDITRRKNDADALREVNARLEEKARDLARSNQDLQQFAYVASHDLQEPLRMISSYTQLLARRHGDKLGGDAKEFMEFIVDGAARMKQLIEDLLEFSRVGTRAREFKPVDSSEVVAKALSNLRAAREASGAQVTLGEMPPVFADAPQLVQLFQNLLGNAMKFRADRPLEIHVEGSTLPDAWRFSVRDNGIGLDPQYADRIFMLFQRLHNKSEYPGTGIGLAVCKKIVERHGGTISVDSAPGEGCDFTFTIRKPTKEAAP